MKLVPEPFKLPSQVEEVVQLAVVDQNHTAVIADHWLVARLAEIDDAQSVVSEGDAAPTIVEVASIVGPSMDDSFCHRLQIAIVAGDALLEKPTSYATHRSNKNKY